jgi:hypothetical protein
VSLFPVDWISLSIMIILRRAKVRAKSLKEKKS